MHLRLNAKVTDRFLHLFFVDNHSALPVQCQDRFILRVLKEGLFSYRFSVRFGTPKWTLFGSKIEKKREKGLLKNANHFSYGFFLFLARFLGVWTPSFRAFRARGVLKIKDVAR